MRWDIQPICHVLAEHGRPITTSTFYDACVRFHRGRSGTSLFKAEIVRAHEAN